MAAVVLAALILHDAPAEEVESRMFELMYADATEVAENFNRTWRSVPVSTNDNCVVGEIAVPFIEANSVMVTALAEILDACAKMVKWRVASGDT